MLFCVPVDHRWEKASVTVMACMWGVTITPFTASMESLFPSDQWVVQSQIPFWGLLSQGRCCDCLSIGFLENGIWGKNRYPRILEESLIPGKWGKGRRKSKHTGRCSWAGHLPADSKLSWSPGLLGCLQRGQANSCCTLKQSIIIWEVVGAGRGRRKGGHTYWLPPIFSHWLTPSQEASLLLHFGVALPHPYRQWLEGQRFCCFLF